MRPIGLSILGGYRPPTGTRGTEEESSARTIATPLGATPSSRQMVSSMSLPTDRDMGIGEILRHGGHEV